MKEYTPYQRKVIERYYRNFDAIKRRRLAELVGEIYLAKEPRREKLWSQARSILEAIEFPASRINHLMARKDPALLARVLDELDET